MPIRVQCPNPACGVTLKAADTISGRRVFCNKCGQPFVAYPTHDGERSDTKKSQPSSTSYPFPTLPAEFEPSSTTNLFPTLPAAFGRYRILRLLGQGGMGAVYLAEDSQLRRQVALKIPYFEASESSQRVERFIREAQAAASLQHPNICTVFDAGQIDRKPFITMAYISGTPLDHQIDPDSLMSQPRAAEIARKIAIALQHAHSKGTVHRDLKPANVMIATDGEPVVMDFGLAKQLTEVSANEVKLTRDGGILGTPSYMSPEQVRGDTQTIGPATDIYSLGVILFEMLTGKTPYSGALGMVMGQILGAPVPPVQEFRPDVDPRLDVICQKAMAKEPRLRFRSMAEFAEALRFSLPNSVSVAEVELVEPRRPVQTPVAVVQPVQSRRPIPAPFAVVQPVVVPEPVVNQPPSYEWNEPKAPAQVRKKSRRRAKPRWTGWWAYPAILASIAAMVLVAGIIMVKGRKTDALQSDVKPTNDPKGHDLGDHKGGLGGGKNPNPGVNSSQQLRSVPSDSSFPRRLLFIHISNYLYLNPLTSQGMTAFAKGGDLTKGAASRLAYEWRVPNDATNNQLYLLSDTAPGQEGCNPMKPVMTGAYERFFETSRAQDRIVVYFGGHVVSRNFNGKDVAFLVPMEGDPDETNTLIPLSDFYKKLEACPATQKVVIWDVCRFNPERGRKRPGSEPMTEEIAAALAAAPPGVQVITTCQPGENALEFYHLQPDGPGRGKFVVMGSSFLAATHYVAGKNVGVKSLGPNDPIPVEDWVKNLSKRVTDVAAINDKSKQTLKLMGGHPETLVAFKADEPSHARFDLPTPPKGALAGDIAEELSLPGLQPGEDDSMVGTFPFRAESLAPFVADVTVAEIMKPENAEKYKLRVTVLDAFKTIRDVWGKKDGSFRDWLELPNGGKVTEATKKEIAKEQEFPALGMARLERAITLLEAVEALRARETRRWQAHYDYALAQCKIRYTYLQEFNLALGNIRTEVLPPLDPKKGQDGYKLIPSERMKSARKEKQYAKEGKEAFEKMIADYTGTPWAVQAKRDRGLSLGLIWQPISLRGEAKE